MKYGLIAVAIFLVAVVGGVITFFILRNSNNKLRQEAVEKFFKLIGEQQKLDTKEINTFDADGVLTEKKLSNRDDRRVIIATVSFCCSCSWLVIVRGCILICFRIRVRIHGQAQY